MKAKNIRVALCSLIAAGCTLGSCESLLDTATPNSQTFQENVFSNEQIANSALLGLYRSLRDSPVLSASFSASVLTGLSGDELVLFAQTNEQLLQFYENDILANNSLLSTPWTRMYNCIYQANAIIEGLENNQSFARELAQHYIGEAKFARSLCYFYLLNLYGEVPLITTTDVNQSLKAGRSSLSDVTTLMIDDLEQAFDSMKADYSTSAGNRTRANRWTAAALLARIYLYDSNWTKAEEYASLVIKSGLYDLVNLDEVFDANSNEAILQWARTATDAVSDAGSFIPGTNQQPPMIISESLLEAFENVDRRYQVWCKSVDVAGDQYYFPFKYTQSGVSTDENFTLLRLAEQFLIRAEARAHLNENDEAVDDINRIRGRTGLGEITGDISTEGLLEIIRKERQCELFAENGHRWFDLKRQGMIDEVLSHVKENWQSTDMLFPIPLSDLGRNPNLTQNPGYD